MKRRRFDRPRVTGKQPGSRRREPVSFGEVTSRAVIPERQNDIYQTYISTGDMIIPQYLVEVKPLVKGFKLKIPFHLVPCRHQKICLGDWSEECLLQHYSTIYLTDIMLKIQVL